MNVTKKMKMSDGSEAATSSPMDSHEMSSAPTPNRRPDPDAIKMFAGQIPRSKSEEDLMEMFKEFGEIYTLNVLRDKGTGLSKGCCFITFYTRAAALAAQDALHNSKVMPGMQHPVQMKPADTEKKQIRDSYPAEERKLFVGMISKTSTEDELKVMFSPYGDIDECTVLRDSQNNHKGCAFVTFSTRSSAKQASLHLHNSTTMDGCSSSIVVRFAFTLREKEAKRAQLTNTRNGVGPMGSPYLPLLPNSPQVNNVPNMGNFGGLSNLAGATGLNPLAIQNLITAATNNTNPVLNQLLKAANPVPNNNNASVNNLQQIQNLQTLSALFSAAAANQASNLNPYGAHNLASLASSPSQNLGGNMNHNPSNLMSGPPLMPGLPGANPALHQNGFGASSMGNNNIGGVGMNGGLNSGGLNSSGMSPDLTQTFSGLQQFAGLVNSAFPTAFNGQQNNTQQQQQQQQPANPAAGKDVEGPDGCNLFIYHLPQEFLDYDLYQTFAAFGNVISAKVFVDKQTNLSKCFGFVSYDNAQTATNAIQSMNGFQIGTKRLKVQLKRSKSDNKPY